MTKTCGVVVSFALVLVAPATAFAADTVEAVDAGATEVDLFFGLGGLDAPGGESFGDVLIGYGLVDGVSAYAGATHTGDEHLGDGHTRAYAGMVATVIDGAHIDVDLLAQLSSGSGELELAPGFELNVDADPDMQSWGSYVRASALIAGAASAHAMMNEAAAHLATTAGAYRTIRGRHQLLVEVYLDFHPDGDRMRMGGIAAGYNVQLSETVELVQQIHATGRSNGVALVAGLIATL